MRPFKCRFRTGCRVRQEDRPISFHITDAPTNRELSEILQKIISKTVRLLEKRGHIQKDEEDHLQVNFNEIDSLAKLQAGAATYRFTLGPNKGKKALTLKTVDEDHTSKRGLVAVNSGFSLHAGVAFNGTEKDKIEKLCRYIARPAVAIERLKLNQRGQVVYTLKKPYTDGTTHIVMTPLELMERLAAIVPRPRVHLTRFSGVFAPHYKYRSLVVPQQKASSVPVPEEGVDNTGIPPKSRISWARLLKRVFNIDVNPCHLCGGTVKILSSIEDPTVIKKILLHLGLPHQAPVLWPARGPPDLEMEDSQQPNFDFS